MSKLTEDQAAAQAVSRFKTEQQAAREALADPLPGPLKEAFALQQSLPVGGLQVRPFYDIDFEFLAALKHPLHALMEKSMSTEEEVDMPLPRGPQAWQVIWILTRPVDDVEAAFAKGGDEVQRLARAEFGRRGLGELAELYKAVVKQMCGYWRPVVAYGPADKPGEGSPAANPSTAPQSTASAG